jgi:hypothetical protein
VAQDDARGLDPFPFHLANVLLHAFVTCLVYWYVMPVPQRERERERERQTCSLPPERERDGECEDREGETDLFPSTWSMCCCTQL